MLPRSHPEIKIEEKKNKRTHRFLYGALEEGFSFLSLMEWPMRERK